MNSRLSDKHIFKSFNAKAIAEHCSLHINLP